MKTIDKAWQPEKFEDGLYQSWESNGFFRPEINKVGRRSSVVGRSEDDKPQTANRKPFVISMPPPNVTGKLHMGHALFATLEDIMTRHHRLKGEPTLWLPGTDHAGIATQAVVDKALRKEGINKNELGREKFVERVWQWKEEYGGIITEQLRRLGASCDWSRERFTLDEGLNHAVRKAFVDLYNKGLIYRGERVVNWCPRCHTAIADDEVEYKEEKSKLYWIKYGPFVLATARPETKLGDTAVAVHPSDNRYKDMVGKTYQIPGVLGEFEIKVVADNAVDPEFGSGAIKVTPAHSMIDWEIAQRHNLPLKQIIDDRGKMMGNTGKYAGMSTRDAREAIVADMEDMGLIDHIDEYDHNIAMCYRCGGQVEPIPSKQWFVKMKPLAEKAKKVVEDGQIKIIPNRFEKVYFHWMDNIRDWCISRQLWWGHQIPVWYRQSSVVSRQSSVGDPSTNDPRPTSNEIYVGMEPPQGEGWVQDPDVLDTWFSSALWPFSTLGWPEDTSDYQNFYPTTVMETGYDILFFWVARMIMFGLEFTGKPPFETVYLHGLVRDEKNRKMSKSLGNVMDPLDLIPKYGTDALRMALVVGSTPGQDSPIGEGKIKGYRNFSNKIWNASRYVILRVSDGDLQTGEIGELRPFDSRSGRSEPVEDRITNYELRDDILTDADKAILAEHEAVKQEVTRLIDDFKFSLAGEKLYEYFWHSFADIYIEESKKQLAVTFNGNEARIEEGLRQTLPTDETGIVTDKLLTKDRETSATQTIADNTKKILIKVLSETLTMLHPFMPFVTEAVWQELRTIYPVLPKYLIIGNWPE